VSEHTPAIDATSASPSLSSRSCSGAASTAALANLPAVMSTSTSRRTRRFMSHSSRCVVVRSQVKTSPSVRPRQRPAARRHASWKASSISSRLACGCHAASCERIFAPSGPRAISAISALVRSWSGRTALRTATTSIERWREKLAPLAAKSSHTTTVDRDLWRVKRAVTCRIPSPPSIVSRVPQPPGSRCRRYTWGRCAIKFL
jgi:hypothetical protein